MPGDGNYSAYNFASVTPALPPGDRQAYYGSFVRDICDKYLTVFGDFKYTRSYFDSSLAAVPFTPDPFHIPGTPFPTVGPSGPNGISVPIQNPFNPFTVGDVTLNINGAAGSADHRGSVPRHQRYRFTKRKVHLLGPTFRCRIAR